MVRMNPQPDPRFSIQWNEIPGEVMAYAPYTWDGEVIRNSLGEEGLGPLECAFAVRMLNLVAKAYSQLFREQDEEPEEEQKNDDKN